MASLSQVTSVTRRVLEYTGIGVAGILVLSLIFSIGSAIKQAIAPTPPPPPTVSFGKLPSFSFPESSIPSAQFSYNINTLTGALPTLPDRATVFKMQAPQPQLLALDQAKTEAKAAGFADSPIQLSDTSYKWTATDPLPMTFTMDTVSFDFDLTSSFLTDATVVSAPFMPTEDMAVKKAQDFFSSVSSLPGNIDSSKTKTTLLAISNGTLVPASSLSTSQIIRVDFFPKPINNLQIYTPDPTQSLIYAFIASSSTTDPELVGAQLIHKDVSKENATYPIKTAQQALTDLKNGKGYIASYDSTNPQINITDVSLGYYEDSTPQNYLMPIIVFQGDHGFFAYVSAVSDNWIK